jgi:hypothetical protein
VRERKTQKYINGFGHGASVYGWTSVVIALVIAEDNNFYLSLRDVGSKSLRAREDD